jgi:hypothetical protein
MKASENLLPAAKKIRKVKKVSRGKNFCAAKLDPAENFALQNPVRQGSPLKWMCRFLNRRLSSA